VAERKKPAAKRGASRYKAPSKRPVPGWIWLACGLIAGMFIALLLNLQPGDQAIKREKPQPERAATGKATPSSSSQEPGKPKYDFYTLLPESEVIVPPDALPAPSPTTPEQQPVTPAEAAKIDAARAQAALNGETPPPPPVVKTEPNVQPPLTTQFFLQAGSFRRKDDAESVRAQIILLGQNVRVESGTVREETWHRVLVGPFANREQLARAQKSLAADGFSNLLLQQRQSH
jgi:cell division protein FtsN